MQPLSAVLDFYPNDVLEWRYATGYDVWFGASTVTDLIFIVPTHTEVMVKSQTLSDWLEKYPYH